MSLTAADIIAIAAAGNAVTIAADGSVTVEPAVKLRADRRQRNRRYYERLKTSESVLNASETSYSDAIKTPPSPPRPPSPTPPTPHTPTPEVYTRDHACEAESGKGQEFNHSKFPLPQAVAAGIQSLHRRRESTPWSPKEIAAARPLTRIQESQLLADLDLFRKARAAGWGFYRRDVVTLLNNWQAEVERSDDYLRTLGNSPPANGRQSEVQARRVERHGPEILPITYS